MKLIQQFKRSRGIVQEEYGLQGKSLLAGQGVRIRVNAKKQGKLNLSSGAIGGAFPLLFGQGGGAALGGAVGGSAGGLMGGQFGKFALSLDFGTATRCCC